MIDLHLYLTFVLAVTMVTILMLIPGPNVALIVANSVAYGTRYGVLTVAGTASAMLVQLALTALGDCWRGAGACAMLTRSATARLPTTNTSDKPNRATTRVNMLLPI